ncbi:MAG: alpha-amylase family glycosyl hydrolase [Tessaracoccus sp.]
MATPLSHADTSTPLGPEPPAWLADAVIYEIYPQSFCDSDGDGIGDLSGVIGKLDYLRWLGIDVIWFNPCFASPFRDAGYDITDYFSVAPRYGSNDTLTTLVEEAGKRGIRVLLDLVAGHTSIVHPWFSSSMMDPEDHRYIWADRPSEMFVPSPGSRQGWYMKNFFPEQPALNFGYARLHPDEPWRQLPGDEWPTRNREMLKEVIGFWLDKGVAGFRVDMAFSLVKDDPGLSATTDLWREISDWMHTTYPGSVLLPESDEHRTLAAGAAGGFDADFALVIQQEHSALFNNGAAGVLPWQHDVEPCYFDPDAEVEVGTAALERFLHLWQERWDQSGTDRLIVLPSSDHDFSRLVAGPRTTRQCLAVFTFLFTWGSIPSIYYGDEIGMRFLPEAPEKEGSKWNPRYNRAGCRTPMQWDNALPNAGFSSADEELLYLPQDNSFDRPTVHEQEGRPDSLLNHVRQLIQLRKGVPALGTSAEVEVLHVGYPFVYRRGGTHLVAINPRGYRAEVTVAGLSGRQVRLLLGDGVSYDHETLIVEPFGHGIFQLSGDIG